MGPKLISRRVMIEEIRPFLPGEWATEVLEISLHVKSQEFARSPAAGHRRVSGGPPGQPFELAHFLDIMQDANG